MLHKFSKLIFVLALVITSVTIAQEKPMQMKSMKSDKQTVDSTMIKKGIINLASIDKNNDGKVFQCPMELNVLSDSKGECPLCGMNLREIAIPDAKAKLLKRGFKLDEDSMKNGSESEPVKKDAKVAIWNAVCPVMGEEVDPEAPTEIYNGKVIGFCCKGCEKKFKADPEKYMKNLSDDGAKFIGEK